MKTKRNVLIGFLVLALVMMSAFTAVSFAEELPDTYTHATDKTSKEVLSGAELEAALQFLKDSSHYLYVNQGTPYYGDYTHYPVTGFNTEWRSPTNGRVYRGPYYDPLSRSVNWLTTNPNGSINSSVGSYWACIAPNTELVIPTNEIQGYEVMPTWQIVCCMSPGQTVNNFIANGRGSLYIDGSMASFYGLPVGWENRNILNVEVELRNYVPRYVTPQDYYDGKLPTTSSWLLAGRWSAVPGWTVADGENQMRSISQFWGCAVGDAAALNLNSDEERAAYIERANNDPAVLEALTGCVYDMHFDILQVVNIVQECGFDFEQASGKVNGIDMDHDGLLDRYPEGSTKAGQLILQNADAAMLPSWAYELNQNLDWWVALDGSIINSEGKKLVGANADGTYILEGEEPEGFVPEEKPVEEAFTIDLADNQKLGVAKGNGGDVYVVVTLDGETITDVKVLDNHHETAGIADAAIDNVPAAIVAQNSADVDSVAGATVTSNAIKDAVRNALAE